MDTYKRNRLMALILGTMVILTVLMGIIAIIYYIHEDSLPPIERAKFILERSPLIDGHNNLAYNIRRMVFNDLRKVDLKANLSQTEPWKSLNTSQTDIQRLKDGHVGGQVWVARADCESQYKDAVPITLEQIDVIKRFLDSNSDDFQLVTTVEEFEKARDDGKIASFIAVEGGHSIQSSLSVLRQYYDLGVRIFTLAHTCSTPWIDYSRADHSNKSLRIVSYSHGISHFGEDVVREMNRLGMIIDMTHSSIGAVVDVMAVSKSPIIFSHSAARTLCDTDTNVGDAILKTVRQKDALVMVSFDSNQIKCDGTDATIHDVIKHIEYIKNRATVNNIGIGSNFDGIEKTVRGLEDPSKFPDLFALLVESGKWHSFELEQLAGKNFLRVLEVKEDLKNEEPVQAFQKRSEIRKYWDRGNCTSPSSFVDPSSSIPTLPTLYTYPQNENKDPFGR
ncbi:Dipeptidase 1 [Folsomia candida]|uniref:Dipeptidase n=1 Tax=Folsomia candida TaxID=158441 RepID=A0A226F422_FOLCA|nr:Dipeptidase 1 [Folsomia candida]